MMPFSHATPSRPAPPAARRENARPDASGALAGTEAVASTVPRITLPSFHRSSALRTSSATVDTAPANTEPDDHALMLAVRAGDLSRLGTLFERHHRPLHAFFVRSTGHPAASEDLVQTVFLRILKYRHTYRTDGRFTTWMYQLARNAAADHFRKSAAAPRLLEKPEDIHEYQDHAPSADEQAAHADELDRMRRALDRLPDEQRELLTLQRFQRLRHDELAEIYGCSVGAMKVRVHRAIAALRDSFFSL